MHFELATSEPLLTQARKIMGEYQVSLGVDLCFQNFEQEMLDLPGKYVPPEGRLYLSYVDEKLIGCVALRPLQELQCEIKRLYVRPEFRGQSYGKELLEKVLSEAGNIGYLQVFLDTLPTMAAAQKLYYSFWFRKIEPYYFNPIEGTVFMRLDLQNGGSIG